jgi:hypothetical protein
MTRRVSRWEGWNDGSCIARRPVAWEWDAWGMVAAPLDPAKLNSQNLLVPVIGAFAKHRTCLWTEGPRVQGALPPAVATGAVSARCYCGATRGLAHRPHAPWQLVSSYCERCHQQPACTHHVINRNDGLIICLQSKRKGWQIITVRAFLFWFMLGFLQITSSLLEISLVLCHSFI